MATVGDPRSGTDCCSAHAACQVAEDSMTDTEGCSGESESSCSSHRWTAQEQLDAAHQPSVALLQTQLARLQLAHREMQAQLGDITAMQQILVAELGATRSLWAMTQSDNELLTAKLRQLHAQATLRQVRDFRSPNLDSPARAAPGSGLAAKLQALQEQHSAGPRVPCPDPRS